MSRRRDGVGNLSNEEKLRLCAFSQENPTMSQKDLCGWAQRTFALSKAPCQATISNILRKRALLQSMNAQDLVCKRRRVLKNPELDRALGNWVLYCLHKGLKVSGELIKKQAATFAELLHPRGDVDMAFSNGWLAGFQDRYGIKKLKRAAPQQSAAALQPQQPTTASAGPLLPPFSAGSPPLEPPAPLPAAPPSATNGGPSNGGPSNGAAAVPAPAPAAPAPARATLTVVVAVNGDGSDPLTHVKVAFLAVKGTAKLQPLNSGVIKALKRRYRLAHFVNALDRSEQGQREIFAVTQLEAMRWVKQCWFAISRELVQHCWAKTRIFGGDALTPLEKRRMKLEDEVEDDIYKHIQWLCLANPLTMEEMLNPDGENEVHAGVSIKDFADCAIEHEFEAEAPGPSAPQPTATALTPPHVDAAADLAVLTNEQKLSHLSFAIRILNDHGALESSKQELRAVQRSIRDAIVEQRRLSRR
ncbi:hypothetical protein PybrP1_000058 [[Pythium] brassicae (nom. inval.)]|nr:hypothetical protein PybrP1_000058 [[Pythium] brassicae (nom. inval.)]